MDGLQLLNKGHVDGMYFGAGQLREECRRLQEWWHACCHAVNSEREHPVLKDETQWGPDWCISLAESLVDAERNSRAGNDDSEADKYLRKQIWERFENLERGLKSNGVERRELRRVNSHAAGVRE